MGRAVLISIQPRWCELIASGKKTIEVRKTKPKLETPFKVYIYCTKGDSLNYLKRPFFDNYQKFWVDNKAFGSNVARANGKVIGEFVCDKIDEYRYGVYDNEFCYHIPTVEGEKTCLEYPKAEEYGNGKPLYFWHISDLVFYDKPRELSEFTTVCEGLKPYQCDKCEYSYTENTESGSYAECCCNNLKPLTRPPQSWCYVEALKGGAE